jgi:hypothetical protein
MDDELDRYLGRSLKNWSAQYQPPVDGRQRLLRRASYPPYQQQKRLSRWISILKNRYFYPEQSTLHHSDWLIVPVTHSSSWSFQLATSSRQTV